MRSVNGDVAVDDVSRQAKVLSTNVHYIQKPSLLLQNDTAWT